MESRIKKIQEYLDLADEMYEVDRRKVIRTTTEVYTVGNEVVRKVTKDEIEFI